MITSDQITRRTIVATGAKLAYAAPVVATSMKLSSIGAGAVSGGCYCKSGVWILSSEANGVGDIFVDDDLIVYVNGDPVFKDWDGGESKIYPFKIEAPCGSKLCVEAYNTYAPLQRLSALWLSCADDVSNTRLLTKGVYDDQAPGPGPENPNLFFEECWTV